MFELDAEAFEKAIADNEPINFEAIRFVAEAFNRLTCSLGEGDSPLTITDTAVLYEVADDGHGITNAFLEAEWCETDVNGRMFLTMATNEGEQIIEVDSTGIRLRYDSEKVQQTVQLGDLTCYATEGLDEVIALDGDDEPYTTIPLDVIGGLLKPALKGV